MKAMLLTAALASGSLALDWDHEFTSELLANENMNALFENWRMEHSKMYGSVEETLRRLEVFRFNMERVARRNDDFHKGEISFTLRMNHFGDLSDEERSALFHPIETDVAVDTIAIDDVELGATQFDWRDKGKVSAVRSQGGCGSCWAFAAVGSMECNYAIAKGTSPPDMSEQQLVDCTGNCYGCDGGWSDRAIDTAIAHGGMCSEADYRYTGRDGYCKDSQCAQSKYKPRSYSYATRRCTSCLESSVRSGCLAVYVAADGYEFGYYSGGVLDGYCGDGTNHVVTLTGYGTMNGDEYWIIKNSWATSWGDRGFGYLCRNCGKNSGNGQCGIMKQQNVLPKY